MAIPIFGEDINIIGEDDGKKRVERCLKKVQEVLDRYDCYITPVVTIVGTKILAGMDIQPKPQKAPGTSPN